MCFSDTWWILFLESWKKTGHRGGGGAMCTAKISQTLTNSSIQLQLGMTWDSSRFSVPSVELSAQSKCRTRWQLMVLTKSFAYLTCVKCSSYFISLVTYLKWKKSSKNPKYFLYNLVVTVDALWKYKHSDPKWRKGKNQDKSGYSNVLIIKHT